MVWVDWLKAFLIFLVILGHLPDELHIKWFIYLFHMPAFFIISGYLYRPRAIKEEMRKIVSQLLFPYFYFMEFV